MKKTLFKTQFLVEFISDEPIEDENLSELVDAATFGELSMIKMDVVKNEPIKGKEAVENIKKHGTDTEFFGIDEKGNEITYY